MPRKKDRPPLTIERVAELLRYCQTTGIVSWREGRRRDDFETNRGFAKWLKYRAGREAGWLDSSTGYRKIEIDGGFYFTHRVAWLLATGCWPSHEIDHINGVRNDNRRLNLRDVPHSLNTKNRAVVGGANPRGVVLRKNGTWNAWIRSNGKHHTLGTYTSESDAIAVRRAAERASGFHSNHGQREPAYPTSSRLRATTHNQRD